MATASTSLSNSWVRFSYLRFYNPAFVDGEVLSQEHVPGAIPFIFVGCFGRNIKEFVEYGLGQHCEMGR